MREEIVIKAESGALVARLNLKDAVLDGHCEWFDGRGDAIAYGLFKNGIPFSGTFLNWTKYFSHLAGGTPYDPKTYCQDWVTMFESCFDSEPPKYELVLEAYFKEQEYSRP